MQKLIVLKTLINAVDKKFETVEQPVKTRIEISLRLSCQEFVSFQDVKSLAQAKGVIDYETAQFIYNALGDWNNQTLGTRFILSKLHADLLKAKINGAL
jgi:hypothetical protein